MAREPRPIKDILNYSDMASGLLSRVREQSELLASVRRELEPPLNEHLIAALMRDKQLLLYADSSAWVSRLRFNSRALRERLASKGVVVSKITARISLPEPTRRTRKRPVQQLSRASSRLIEELAESISDVDLRVALQRLSRHGH